MNCRQEESSSQIWRGRVLLQTLILSMSVGGALLSASASGLENQAESVYTLHLTHYLRFSSNGEGRNVQTQETLRLTEADFEEGI